MAKIFLSHSHPDEELAHELASQIRQELEFSRLDVFVSSEPEAIPEGQWNTHLHEQLTEVQAFIPLITPSSERSMWVAFESGNFWARKGGKFIYPLVHPKADISTNPLNSLQHKSVTEIGHLWVFFEELCKCFGRAFMQKADLDAIVQKANKTPTITSADRQLQLICKLQLITATSLDVKKAILRWMKERDILHDAQFNWMGDLQNVTFTEANMQRINLGGNDLRGASFWASDLENAKLGSTNLRGSDFNKVTSLSGASFQGAKLDGTTTLPNGDKYKEELGLEQLVEFGAVIDR